MWFLLYVYSNTAVSFGSHQVKKCLPACAKCADSYLAYAPCLIQAIAIHWNILWYPVILLRTVKDLTRLGRCAGWSVPSLSAYVWRHIFAWHCPFYDPELNYHGQFFFFIFLALTLAFSSISDYQKCETCSYLTWHIISSLHGLKHCSIILWPQPIFNGLMTLTFFFFASALALSPFLINYITYSHQMWYTFSPWSES